MRGNRGRDTGPERALRSLLHARGLRYRVGLSIRLPERRVRPDIVFLRARLVVYVDGCFWHVCPVHGSVPRTNRGYWEPKLRRNTERDRAATAALEAEGWRVLRFWEHVPATEMAAEVVKTLAERTAERQATDDAHR